MDNPVLNRLVRHFEPLLAGRRIGDVHAIRAGVQLSLEEGPFCFSLLQQLPVIFSQVQKVTSEGGFSRIAGCLMRHIRGAVVNSVRKPPADRRIAFELERDAERLTLWFEAIPKRVDLLLVDASGTVLCSTRDPGQEGEAYEPPEMVHGELSLFESDEDALLERVSEALQAEDPASELVNAVDGVDKAMADELVATANSGQDALRDLVRRIRESDFDLAIAVGDRPRLLPNCYRAANDPNAETIADPGEAAARYFGRRIRSIELNSLKTSISSVLRNKRKRIKAAEKKLEAEEEQLATNARAGQIGDLILANMHRIRRGMDSIEVENYYDESGGTMRVELDPILDPSANAERYYKRSRKARRGAEHVKRRKAELERERKEVETVAARLEESADELKELRRLHRELTERGWIVARKKKDRPAQLQPGRRFISSEGCEIVIGRNNADNERVTFGVGRENDFWMHAAGCPGSHVVVRNPRKLEEPTPVTLAEASALAAYYSKARNSSNVQVHWTLRRYVRKIKGAEPGKVALTVYSSVIADPEIPKTVRVKQ